MDVTIRDGWFHNRTIVRVAGGEDALVFERCTFNGGELRIDREVDRVIFSSCLFFGTVFPDQPLTSRIARDCHWERPHREDAMPSQGLSRVSAVPRWGAAADIVAPPWNASIGVPVPASLRSEHETLRRELEDAVRAPEPIGEAARAVTRLFERRVAAEEAFALPPLGLLDALAQGKRSAEMPPALALSDRLKAELPRFLAEHETIIDTLNGLAEAARASDDEPRLHLANQLLSHIRIEEEVLYPAAVLIGEYLTSCAHFRARQPVRDRDDDMTQEEAPSNG